MSEIESNADPKMYPPGNFVMSPLSGSDMERILRVTGTKNGEFSKYCGKESGEWTRNHYRKPKVPLKIAEAFRKFIGEENFDQLIYQKRAKNAENKRLIAESYKNKIKKK